MVWGGVEIWEVLEGMKGMVEIARSDEIIQRVRTKKIKDRKFGKDFFKKNKKIV